MKNAETQLKNGALPIPIVIALIALCVNVRAAGLQQLIDAAQPGATLTVPAGSYDGPIVIRKPLTLRAGSDATIRGDAKTHVVRIAADHVTVEGFHICHSGLDLGQDHAGIFVTGNFAIISENLIDDSLHGIYLKKVTDCRIVANRIHGKTEIASPVENPDASLRPDAGENCTIFREGRRGNGVHLWNSGRIVLRGNEISDARDGIYFSFTHHSQVTGNIIRHVRFGLHYMYSDYNYFEGNRFFQNTAGASIMYSKGLLVRRNMFTASVGHRSYGLALTAVDDTRFEENQITGNSVGIHLQLCNNNTFLGNNIARNYIGVRIATSCNGNRFSRNVLAGNLHPAEIDGNAGDNGWSIGRVGNRWENSAEIDLNGDSIGDFPHRETDLLGSLRRPFPLVALLSGSPAIDLVRFAQQHAAIPKIAAIIDPTPLTAGFRGAPAVDDKMAAAEIPP